jgi:hypothetical protein
MDEWREGSVSLTIVNNVARVIVHRNGKDVVIIDTIHGGTTSHSVTKLGIDRQIERQSQSENFPALA